MEVRQGGSNSSQQSLATEDNMEELRRTTPFLMARLQRSK